MNALQGFASASVLLLLTACAGIAPPPAGAIAWQQQRDQVQAISHFTASGKIALRTPEQAESASLLWLQEGPATHIRLSGPMGMSATTVDSNGSDVVIRQGEQSRHWDLDDPALQHQPGWNLPLGSLHHWLKGVPAPGLELQALQLNTEGQLPLSLQQQGWLVRYDKFADFEGFTLPTRISMAREGTTARIIVRRWQDISAL